MFFFLVFRMVFGVDMCLVNKCGMDVDCVMFFFVVDEEEYGFCY